MLANLCLISKTILLILKSKNVCYSSFIKTTIKQKYFLLRFISFTQVLLVPNHGLFTLSLKEFIVLLKLVKFHSILFVYKITRTIKIRVEGIDIRGFQNIGVPRIRFCYHSQKTHDFPQFLEHTFSRDTYPLESTLRCMYNKYLGKAM